jgi:NADH dehydrogenase FAD-containing subunit
VLALGSQPNDFAIPGLAQRALSLYSASDAERVWAAVSTALTAAAAAADPGRQRRLATVGGRRRPNKHMHHPARIRALHRRGHE